MSQFDINQELERLHKILSDRDLSDKHAWAKQWIENILKTHVYPKYIFPLESSVPKGWLK